MLVILLTIYYVTALLTLTTKQELPSSQITHDSDNLY